MPYIGRDLNRGNYLKLDDISSSFNGSTQTFNLTVGGSAFTPGSAFSILVSVGGVIQEPESSYQVNNSEITFANAPTAQDGFFCIALGVPISIGVPGNGTVNGTQMAKPFNYDGFFYLNDANNRVGINSSIPTVALDVIGDTNISGDTSISGDVNVSGILTAGTYSGPISNPSGISTFYNLRVSNNLTVEGTTSTLDTDLIGVDRVEVGANSNTIVGVAVTQSGTADLVNLFDGATKVVTIDDQGNIGLGTDAPTAPLHIHKTSGTALARLENTNGTSQLDIRHTNGYGAVHYAYQGSEKWRAGQTAQFSDYSIYQSSGVASGQNPYRFVIKNSGNVGVSTFEPRQILHVNKPTGTACVLVSSPTAPQIRFNPNVTDGTDNDRTIFGQATSNGHFVSTAVAGDSVLRGTNTGNILFGIATSEKLRITSSGRVGINENSPDVDVHIKNTNPAIYLEGTNGSGRQHKIWSSGTNSEALQFTSGSLLYNADIHYFRATNETTEYARFDTGGRLLIGGNSNSASSHADELQIINTSAQGGLSIINASNGQGNIYFGHSGGTADGRIEYSHQADYMRFFTANDERLRIISDGKVGIGTNTPQTALEIGKGHTDPVIRLNDPADRRMSIRGPSANNFASVGTETSHALMFFTNGYSNERFRITSGGSVNIGGDYSQTTYNFKVTGTSYLNGVVRVPNGSAAAPAIHFGDSDSGLYGDASNGVRITAGGSDRIVATSNGVTFPPKATALTSFTLGSQSALSKPLYFADAASVESASILLDNSSQELRIKNGRFSGEITFTTYNAEKLRILSNGHLRTQGNNNGNPVGMELRNNNTAAYSHAELSLTSQNATTSKIWCDVPNAGMRLQYNGGTTVKINQSGNLVMANDSGIDFSSETNEGSTSQNALLADYEEGVWTPTNTIGMTLTVNNGAHYIKIGKQVTVWFDITLTGNPDSAQCSSIENLPYVSKSSNTYYGQSNSVWYSNTNNAKRDYDDDNTLIFVNNNSTTIRIWNVTSGHDRVRSWANGRRFRGTVTYIAKN